MGALSRRTITPRRRALRRDGEIEAAGDRRRVRRVGVDDDDLVVRGLKIAVEPDLTRRRRVPAARSVAARRLLAVGDAPPARACLERALARSVIGEANACTSTSCRAVSIAATMTGRSGRRA
jgi:hypothetical protein